MHAQITESTCISEGEVTRIRRFYFLVCGVFVLDSLASEPQSVYPLQAKKMAKAVREAYGKGLLARHLQAIASSKDGASRELAFPAQTATVTAETDFKQLAKEKPWLETEVRSPACLLAETPLLFKVQSQHF